MEGSSEGGREAGKEEKRVLLFFSGRSKIKFGRLPEYPGKFGV